MPFVYFGSYLCFIHCFILSQWCAMMIDNVFKMYSRTRYRYRSGKRRRYPWHFPQNLTTYRSNAMLRMICGPHLWNSQRFKHIVQFSVIDYINLHDKIDLACWELYPLEIVGRRMARKGNAAMRSSVAIQVLKACNFVYSPLKKMKKVSSASFNEVIKKTLRWPKKLVLICAFALRWLHCNGL